MNTVRICQRKDSICGERPADWCDECVNNGNSIPAAQTSKHPDERAEFIWLAEALESERNPHGHYTMQAARALRKAAAQRPAMKPLTEVRVRNMCGAGPVYAPDGVVTRRPNEYRREMEDARVWGFRMAEAAHGIKEQL